MVTSGHGCSSVFFVVGAPLDGVVADQVTLLAHVGRTQSAMNGLTFALSGVALSGAWKQRGWAAREIAK